jgi:hypothetical protein
MVGVLSGCATVESGSVWDIKLKNDSPQFLIVKDCASSSCASFRYIARLAPGETVSAHDYGDGTSRWIVTSRDGRRLGCLMLGISKRVDGYVLRTSTTAPCR